MREQIVETKQVQEEYSCCNGKLFFVTDRKRALLTLTVTTMVLILHETFHLSWFSTRHYFFSIYVLFVFHFVHYWSFILIMTTNPGLIQKIEYEYEKELDFLDIPKNEHSRSHIQISNVINIQSKTAKIKLCHTCNVYRPPRTHHCSECGVCIERLDHHCPWLGVCIGKANYKYFYAYLLSLIILIIDVVAMCFTILIEGVFVQVLPILLIIVCVPFFIFSGIMLFFHTYLIMVNLTTREYLDEFWNQMVGNPDKKPNPFKNLLKVLFTKSEREVEFRYTQFQLKNQAESSSEQRMSTSKESSNKKGSKGSNSDEHNNSSNVFKGAAIATKNQEKQNAAEDSSISLRTNQEKKASFAELPGIIDKQMYNKGVGELSTKLDPQPPLKEKPGNNSIQKRGSEKQSPEMIEEITLKVQLDRYKATGQES